jgi:hypothetical protein
MNVKLNKLSVGKRLIVKLQEICLGKSAVLTFAYEAQERKSNDHARRRSHPDQQRHFEKSFYHSAGRDSAFQRKSFRFQVGGKVHDGPESLEI